ncbi:MAG TPA: glycosyltransferase family 9 protein [Chloroflexota bacterium]|nr:glycosyltransferase family 9 protein [Chloroflexota bacterium]
MSTRPARPESELYLDLLRAVGGRPASGELEYFPSPQAIEQMDRLVGERLRGERFVVLHAAGGVNPGMSLLRKRWPVQSFVALARRIQEAGVTIVLVGAPQDRGAAEEICDELSSAGPGEARNGQRASHKLLNLTGELSLDELAELARRAVVYIGNDSGPTHLAEAAGARVIAVFGPSDPVVYGPRAPNAVAISAGFWCSPCFEAGRVAPCVKPLCMPAISVERVWRVLAPWLG